MARFTDFILRLGSDPGTLQKLRTSPHQAFKDAGLSAAEQTVLLQGDPDAVRLTIARELGVDSSLIKPFYTLTISLTEVHVHIEIKE
jgi:hypothetical protein